MKLVFDTNVYISGLLFKGGVPSRLLDLAADKKFELFFSPAILEELRLVLKSKFHLNAADRDRVLRWLEVFGKIVYPETRLKIVKADDADNRILECAESATVDFLVTGDKKHLLSLKKKFSFKILSPSDFYQLFTVAA